MLLEEIMYTNCDYEIVYLNEDGEEILDEGAIRQLKKVGGKIKKQYRCTSGQKAGKIVADIKSCAKRKDPKKKRHGKKVARSKKGIRTMKSKISKKKTISRLITKMNRRLSGKS